MGWLRWLMFGYGAGFAFFSVAALVVAVSGVVERRRARRAAHGEALPLSRAVSSVQGAEAVGFADALVTASIVNDGATVRRMLLEATPAEALRACAALSGAVSSCAELAGRDIVADAWAELLRQYRQEGLR